MDTAQSAPIRGERVAWGWFVPAGLLAALVAAGTNAVVYLAATAVGAMPPDIDVTGQGPITLPMVAAMSVFGAVAGTVVYALVGRFARRPVHVFRVVAAVALVLSFAGPFTIPGAPAVMVATLLLMHVIAAAVIVGVLTTMTVRKA